MQFRIYHIIFCEQHKLLRNSLAFDEYVQHVYEKFLMEIVEIRLIDWAFLCVLILLNWARTSVKVCMSVYVSICVYMSVYVLRMMYLWVYIAVDIHHIVARVSIVWCLCARHILTLYILHIYTVISQRMLVGESAVLHRLRPGGHRVRQPEQHQGLRVRRWVETYMSYSMTYMLVTMVYITSIIVWFVYYILPYMYASVSHRIPDPPP